MGRSHVQPIYLHHLLQKTRVPHVQANVLKEIKQQRGKIHGSNLQQNFRTISPRESTNDNKGKLGRSRKIWGSRPASTSTKLGHEPKSEKNIPKTSNLKLYENAKKRTGSCAMLGEILNAIIVILQERVDILFNFIFIFRHILIMS